MRKEKKRHGARVLAGLLALTAALTQTGPGVWGAELWEPASESREASLEEPAEISAEASDAGFHEEQGEADETLVSGGLMGTTGQASLTNIEADEGTMVWDDQGGKLTLPADVEEVRLWLQPAASNPPTAVINGVKVEVAEHTEPFPIAPGEVKKLEITTTAKDTSTCTYPLYIHRTEASFVLEAGEAEYRESAGKRVFPVTLRANSACSVRNLSLSLIFDPAKLALAHCETGKETSVIGQTVEALPAAEGAPYAFLNSADPTAEKQWGYLFEASGGSGADNANGRLRLEVLPHYLSEDGPYETQEGEALLRIWFQIRDESPAFDKHTLKLAVGISGVEPQEGIRVSEKLTDQALSSFESSTHDMIRFANLESLYQEGDSSSSGGGTVDRSEPYFGDVLLTVNDPYDALGSLASGPANIQGTGVSFSEEQGETGLFSGSEETGSGGTDPAAGAGGEEKAGVAAVSGVEQDEKGREVQVLSYVPDFEAEGDETPALQSEAAADLPLNLLSVDPLAANYTATFQQISFYKETADGPVKSKYTPAEMTLFGSTEHLYLWYDPAAPGMDKLDKGDLERLVQEAETNYVALTGQYGPIWDKDGNGKLDILLYDIADLYSQTKSYYQGLFDPQELFGTAGGGTRGNNRDVLHLDTYPTFSQSELTYEGDALFATLSTLVHEGQHLTLASNVHERGGKVTTAAEQARWTPVWLNEGLSVMAEHTIVGPVKQRLHVFGESSLIYNGELGLAHWDSGNAMDSYALSYVFLGWLYAQAKGDGMTDEEYAALFYDRDYQYEGTQLEQIAGQIPSLSGMDTKELLQSFALAVYLKDAEGLYGFRGDTDFDTARVKVQEKTAHSLRPGGMLFSQLSAGGFTPEWGAEGTGSSVAFAGIGSPEGTAELAVRADPEGGGTVVQSRPNGTVELGAQVELTAKPAEGYVFTGWSGDVSPEAGRWNSLSVVMARDKTLTAHFAEEGQGSPDEPESTLSLTVTAAPAEEGQVMVTAPGYGARYTDEIYGLCSAAYRIFTELTLTALPKEGYGLAGWYLDGAETPFSTASAIQRMLTKDEQVEARFVEMIGVTAAAKSAKGGIAVLTAAGEAAVSGPALSGQWRRGSVLTLTAKAKEGYDFLGWYAEPAAGGSPQRVTAEETLEFTLDESWLTRWKPELTMQFRRQIEPGGEFEPMEPLPESELAALLSMDRVELLDRNPEEPGALVLASRNEAGSLTAALELSIPDRTVSGGAVLRSLADVPKTQAVKLTARAQPGYLFTGWELVRKESAEAAGLNAAEVQRAASASLNAAEITAAQAADASLAAEPAAEGAAAAGLAVPGTVTEYDTRQSIELVLEDYVKITALMEETGSEMPTDQAALADLRVSVPSGRQLIRRGAAETQKFGYTGSVELYDLYLMAEEDSLTLTPCLYSDAYTARVSWGGGTWTDLRAIPSSGGEEGDGLLLPCAPLNLSFASGETEKRLTLEVTWNGWQGSTPVQESKVFTIDVHRSNLAAFDPLLTATVKKVRRATEGALATGGAVAADAAAESQVTAALQYTKAAGAQFTLDLSTGAALTVKDGMEVVSLGQEAGSVLSVRDCLTLIDERFSLAAARLERLEGGGQRLYVSLLPSAGGSGTDAGAGGDPGAVSITTPCEVLRFYITGGYPDVTLPEMTEDASGSPANLNVIADGEKGELRNRTVLRNGEAETVKVTGLLLSCNPGQMTEINMVSQDDPGLSYWVTIPEGQEQDDSQAGETARKQARQKEAAVQSFELDVVGDSLYTIRFLKEGSLELTLTNVMIGQEDRNLNDWLVTCAALDAEFAEQIAGQMTDAGVIELLCGDLDGDGLVSALDRVALTNSAHYGAAVGGVGGAELSGNLVKYDLDGDGFIRAFDARLIERHYGERKKTFSLPAVIGR